MKTRKEEYRRAKPERINIFFIFFVLCFFLYAMFSVSASAQDDVVSLLEMKQKELIIKEKQLAEEDKKLKALKKDIEEKTEKYTKLLNELDIKLKRIEKIKADRFEYVVKVYEAMTPEEAASKLTALDEQTAIDIMGKMKSKKAGAVMTYMDAKKVAAITYGLTKIEKKFPAE